MALTTYSPFVSSTYISGIMYLMLLSESNPLPGLGSSVLIKSAIPWTSAMLIPMSLEIRTYLLSAKSFSLLEIISSISSVNSPKEASCIMRHSFKSLAPTPEGSKVWITSRTLSQLSKSTSKTLQISSNDIER